MKMKPKIAIITIVLLLSQTLFLTATSPTQPAPHISQVEKGLLPMVIISGEPTMSLAERMKHYKVPGLSIAIIKDFNIQWVKHYGFSDASMGTPVSDETLFNVGSLSKGVASLGFLNLVKEDKIQLDRDVNEQLTSWQIPANDFSYEVKATPRLLMNHSGGIMFSPPYSYLPGALPTILELLKGEKPAGSKPVVIDRKPGSTFQYSNAGFSIMQQLSIEKSGMPFPEYMTKNILNPLGMKHSSFAQPLPDHLLQKAAAGHMPNGKTLPVKRYLYPNMAAGGLWTTARDYAEFVIELQKSYLGKSNKIITQELTSQMLAPQAAKQYGMGVFLRGDKDVTYFSHAGDNRGFFAGYAGHINSGYGAVVLTNSQNGYNLLREILNGIAKVYGWKDYLPQEIKKVAINQEELQKYPGRYQTGPDSLVEIEMQNNQLWLTAPFNMRLYHTGEGKFVSKHRKGYIQFNTQPNGKIDTAQIHLSDNLGRLQGKPSTGKKINSNQKIPYEWVKSGELNTAAAMYRNIRKKDPNHPHISENRFNRMGYNFLNKKQFTQAIWSFNIAVEFYPNSANAYDSLGEAHMKAGNKKEAIKHYRKSLKLNPNNQNATTILNQLHNK